MAEWRDGAIVVRGAGLPGALAVVPAGALGLESELVLTAGSWVRSADEARFTPRFASMPDTEFAILAESSDAHTPWRELARVRVPARDRAPTTVVELIDPGVAVVPANLLRFSITFSAEMDEGSAAGHIRLLDERGADIPGALLEMPPELWDRDRRRLTVLLEPGRIKRGLQPNLQAGPPLVEGDIVTLAVDARMRDAEGSPLLTGASRSYRVGPPERSRVDPSRWLVRWPNDPGEPMRVQFDRPLDRALVRRCLLVLDRQGSPVSGHATLDAEGKKWVFAADPDGDLGQLRIDRRLEDLAGNSVRRVFDRDLHLDDDNDVERAVLIPRDVP
jgi:hypothetical protein